MSLGATGAPIAAPKNTWTLIATAKASAYVQSLNVGVVYVATAASLPSDPPGATQGAHPISSCDGIVPFPDLDTTKNVYVYPANRDAKIIVTAG